jgi:hypothetical protein
MRQIIPAVSQFNIPVRIRSVTTSDLRVKPIITTSVIEPHANVPNFIEIVFNPISSFVRGHIIRVRHKNLVEDEEAMFEKKKVKELHLRSKEQTSEDH